MTTTTTAFDDHALARLPSAAPFVEAIQAFEAFETLPIPSQETEEWRYTDLEGFGFDLRPFVEGGRAENLTRCPRRSSPRPVRSASAPVCRSSGTPR